MTVYSLRWSGPDYGATGALRAPITILLFREVNSVSKQLKIMYIIEHQFHWFYSNTYQTHLSKHVYPKERLHAC
jgi:hypothetical protein